MFSRKFYTRIWQCGKYLMDSETLIKVVILTGNVSKRLTPELKRNGNSVVECFPEEEKVGGSNPSRSTKRFALYEDRKCKME